MYSRVSQKSISLPVVGAEQSDMIIMSVKSQASPMDASEEMLQESTDRFGPERPATGEPKMVSTASGLMDQKKLAQNEGLAPLAEVTVKGLEDKTRWADPWVCLEFHTVSLPSSPLT